MRLMTALLKVTPDGRLCRSKISGAPGPHQVAPMSQPNRSAFLFPEIWW